MGYNLNPVQLVEQKELLDQMVGAQEQGISLLVECDSSEFTNTQYRLNQLLKVCELNPTWEGGKYASLRRNLRLRVGPKGILIEPRALAPATRPPEDYGSRQVPTVSGGDPTENSALAYLATYQGTMPMVRFKASDSWDPESWVMQVEAMGYQVHGYEKDEQGMTIVAVERKKEKTSAFDIIGR